jgi:hypothetical protein
MPYHTNVVTFLRDQIADVPKIVLKKKTRTECDALFVANGLTKISDSFDYLMRLPISSFTAEQIAKHESQLAELNREIERLRCTKAADMWLMELAAV